MVGRGIIVLHIFPHENTSRALPQELYRAYRSNSGRRKNRYKYSGLNLSKTETLNTQYIEEIKYVQELSLKAKATLSPRLDVSGTYAKYLGATNLYDCKGTPSRLALVSIKVLLVLIPLIASIPYLLL